MTKQELIERNLKIVEDYVNTPDHLKICKELCKNYNLKTRAYTEVLKKAGIKIYQTNRNNTVTDAIFDNIDTEEKAYWFGFICADGCIYDKNRIEITLSAIDETHLQKFAKFIDPIKGEKLVKVDTNKKYPTARVSFRSTHMTNVLNNYGCTSRKSLTLKFPNIEIFKNNTVIHFLRGYFDGDGCLCVTDKTKSFSVLGTKNFLNNFQKYLKMDRMYPLYLHKKDSVGTYTFNLQNVTAMKASFKLYNEATIFLDRKYEKYKKICRLYEESYKLLQTNIGEGCDANTEISSEIKESEPS